MSESSGRRLSMEDLAPIERKVAPSATSVEFARGKEYVAARNTVFSCQSHGGQLVLDKVSTARNVLIGVAFGATVGAGLGAGLGAFSAIHGGGAVVAGHAAAASSAAATSGLTTAAEVASHYTLTSGAMATAAASGATTGAVVGGAATTGAAGAACGSAVGGATKGLRSMMASVGEYRWSCCGLEAKNLVCSKSLSMHIPKMLPSAPPTAGEELSVRPPHPASPVFPSSPAYPSAAKPPEESRATS
jgi:hypothetical protein